MPPPKDPYRYFRIEARDLLDQLGRGVLTLEKNPGDPQAVPKLLRLAHTLKGAARVVKQREVADAAHAIEEVLTPLREGAPLVQREQIDQVLAQLDHIATRLAALAAPPDSTESGAANPLPTPPHEAMPPALPGHAAERDALLDGLAQTHAQVTALRQDLATAQRARALVDLLAAPQHGPQAATATADELRTLLSGLERRMASSLDQIDRELKQVRDTAEQLHLVPAAALFVALERTARDAAQALGKHVVFEGQGGDVRLDAQVLGLLQGALVQMVRNAVAHGIEPAAQRLAAGKPPHGLVQLGVARQGRQVVFSCSDDGAGVDLDAVRRAAQRRGGPAQALDSLDAQALLQRLLQGGLSTAAQVTEVAGRGIGLDLVRDVAQRLGAELTVRTTAGQGTRLQVTVPVSIAALQVLEVQMAGLVAAIPLDGVHRTLRYDPRSIARTAQGDSLVHDGQALPFITLARALQAPVPASIAKNAGAPRQGSAVIVRSAQGLAALGVDRLLGAASVVMRPLPDLTPAADVVAGASLDAHGQPQLVLDPAALVQQARRAGAPAALPAAERVPVLVVDDSLTTRMLEQSILESAGYLVHAAVSAEDALERARQQRYALFLVDVEMPGMDGFCFIERTRADPLLRGVPAILVTSRASPEDRRRGKEVGAQGYIVKSEFAQAEFLQRVQELVQ